MVILITRKSPDENEHLFNWVNIYATQDFSAPWEKERQRDTQFSLNYRFAKTFQ